MAIKTFRQLKMLFIRQKNWQVGGMIGYFIDNIDMLMDDVKTIWLILCFQPTLIYIIFTNSNSYQSDLDIFKTNIPHVVRRGYRK